MRVCTSTHSFSPREKDPEPESTVQKEATAANKWKRVSPSPTHTSFAEKYTHSRGERKETYRCFYWRISRVIKPGDGRREPRIHKRDRHKCIYARLAFSPARYDDDDVLRNAIFRIYAGSICDSVFVRALLPSTEARGMRHRAWRRRRWWLN